MKYPKHIALVALLLVGASGVYAQSLGDYARNVRKNKPETTSASRHYDNDNLPTNDQVSVVGPPATDSNQAPGAASPNSAVAAAANAQSAPGAPAGSGAADRDKAAKEWQEKLDRQKQKIDALNHELDLDQREYRLKAAAFYGDAGTRLRDAAQFDKDGADHKTDIEAKQKAIEAAQQELDGLQEQARKAGIKDKDKDDADKSAGTGNDQK